MIKRLLYILLAAFVLSACSKPESPLIWAEPSTNEVVLPTSSAEGTFTITAKGAWKIVCNGSGFSASPLSGGKGDTEVTVTLTDQNPDSQRRKLGTITIYKGDEPGHSVDIYQGPSVAPQTVLMYMPWSGDSSPLTSFFKQNIADMESVIAEGNFGDERILVFFMESASQAELFELYYDNGQCLRYHHKTYTTIPAFSTAAGITTILEDVKQTAPAQRYAMTIGSHGMAWLPGATAAGQRAYGAPREKEYWEYGGPGVVQTRWFGGSSNQTNITTLAQGISDAGIKMEYILFDDCYMSSVEVAYDLRDVTGYLIGSTSEIMAYGFPYALMGSHMVGTVDYEGICDEYHNFYMNYTYPYGTISVIVCSEVDALADIMREINSQYTIDDGVVPDLQRLDGYTPIRFFDMGDYVDHLCAADPALLARFRTQLGRTVPHRRNTPNYYTMMYVNGSHVIPINTFSGITTSDPSLSPTVNPAKAQTAWWAATH